MRSDKYPHGRRMQEKCLAFIEERLPSLQSEDTIQDLLRLTVIEYKVPLRTLRRWYSHFQLFGEYPFETNSRMKKLRKLHRKCRVTKVITTEIIQCIQDIVDEHPEYYLDEIQTSLCSNMSIFISISTIHRILTDKLGYTLQVCYEAAAQRNESERSRYQTALECLTTNANQLVFVDETHKDKQASRRRRAWGRSNSGGIALIRWFKNTIRYTMIAAMDVNGFIDSSIDCVKRNDTDDEPNTVDSQYFEYWVETFLCPVLGSYANGEPRSIVVMDNAATHMSEKVGQLIRSTGAYLLYTAPYSPDLNPIELCFNIYKNHLKLNNIQFDNDWYIAHLQAIDQIGHDISIKEFRKCGVSFSNEELTSDKEKQLAIVIATQLI